MFPQTWHQGLPASPGAAFGKVVFCADEALTKTKSYKMKPAGKVAKVLKACHSYAGSRSLKVPGILGVVALQRLCLRFRLFSE